MKQSRQITLEQFVRYGKIRRAFLRWYDRPRYNTLSYEAKRLQFIHGFQAYTPPAPPSVAPGQVMTFKHSGNAGDIIYALPTLRELAGDAGGALSLALDVPMQEQQMKHPLGSVQLNRQIYDKLEPLLVRQDYIRKVSIDGGLPVDCDLDAVRKAPLRMDRLGISRWYFYVFGVSCDLSKPWLRVEPDKAFGSRVVVARSLRYRNRTLDYRILNQFDAPVFVGLEDEYWDFRQYVQRAEWVQVGDFHQLARIIAGSRLFIGNQSFPFSLAEALKVPRLLELDPGTPNVVPTGENAYDVLFQCQFEHVVRKLVP